MENTNDTNIEEEIQVEAEADTTDETVQEETVENFSEELDKAETEEDALAAFKNIKPEEEEPADEDVEEEVNEEELDTEAEPKPTSHALRIKDGDIEFELNPDDEAERKQIIRLAQQGLNYAGKTTELAKHKSFVQYAEENGITLEDIKTLSDIKAGKKEALSAVAKQANIDLYDVDSDMADTYKPDPVVLPPVADPVLDQIANEILADDSAKESFQKWFPTMPQDVQEQVMSNSQVLRGVQEDITSGVFDLAMNQAYKYQRVDGMDFGSAYTRAKNEVITLRGEQNVTPPVSRGERVRASGSKPVASANHNRGGYAEGVISDMSDEDFMANYRDIINSVRQQA